MGGGPATALRARMVATACGTLLSTATATAALNPTAASSASQEEVRIGSKKFTESVVLGEILARLAEDAGAEVTHRAELGGTRILWNALRQGEIDAYPEYTGTIRQEILGGEVTGSLEDAVAAHGIVMSRPLGFNNTYAIGMREEVADSLGIRRVSDLGRHPALKFGFTSEFMDRADGWPGLRERYRLPHENVRGLDHDLAYRGIATGALHVVDLYSTDAEIRFHELRVLEDDLAYFPEYHAVILQRADLEERQPRVTAAFRRLEGRVPEAAMVAMNARAKIERVPEARVAADFATEALGFQPIEVRPISPLERLVARTREHLWLVGVSLLAAIVVAVPLGIGASRRARLGQVILGVTGVIQTIPSLAILVFMIPLLGIGPAPAIVAMFLYSLLPIVRNTHAGLVGIAPEIRESAVALGLPDGARLRLVELPIASRSILAGIKTAAVINVGTATLAALIGAGGYGQPIFTGIRLWDVGLILQGAVPAAGLALLVQGVFELAERWFVPAGLRLEQSR